MLFHIVSLAGRTVAELPAEPSDSVLSLKRSLHEQLATAAPCWQRLIFGTAELRDPELLGDLPFDFEPDGSVHLNLVLSVDPFLLLKDGDRALEAAAGLDVFGAACASEHLAPLFEAEDGGQLAADVIEERLFGIVVRLDTFRRPPPLEELKLAVLPHALALLQRGDLRSQKLQRLARIFNWLGVAAVPRLVAWLGLLRRPIDGSMQWRADMLRQYSDFARIRLAAKVALGDKGGIHLARVKELGELRRSMARYEEAAGDSEREALAECRALFEEQLRQAQATGPTRHVQYAAERALQ